MKTITNNYATFNAKGLTDVQINFLSECEKLFFDNKPIDLDMLKEAFKNAGYTKGTPEAKECLDAWHYWESMPLAYDRQSMLNPINLTDILTPCDKTTKGAFYVSKRDGKGFYALPNMDYFNGEHLTLSLIYSFNTDNFYFTLNEYGYLWLNYQQIIGSRFIANTIS